MAEYLKQKASPGKDAVDFLEKEREFNKGLQQLKSSPVEMVDDFQKVVSKDLPVDKINKLGDVQKIKSGGEFMADQIIRDARKNAIESVGDTLNYKELKKQFANKAKMAARTGGKKLLGAVPVIGGIANALMSQDASAAVPGLDSAESLGPAAGTLDDRIAKGTLTPEDKQQLALEQAKIRELQSIK